MQRMFGPGSPWEIAWMPRILPQIKSICADHARHTIFTRFIPPASRDAAPGTWKRYYDRWPQMTRDRLDPERLELMPDLGSFLPPARLLDKQVYSPWFGGALDRMLRKQGIGTLILTGGETDVCVLATVMGAVDRGLRAILVSDALCSSVDATHDALMKLYRKRFGVQIETVTTEALLEVWR
jgi:nicotinamidase-related amidase